jgi:cytochrome c oxidase assembly protein subunit 15
VPGTIAIGAALAAIGATLGRKLAKRSPAARRWSASFARIAVFATLLLLAMGGIVTGNEAGLAVPDWPNSFHSNMFFYPLSRMTGAIYYEHAHRLFGSLVGLTTLAFAVVIFVDDRRGWLRGLAGFAFLLVCVQGVLGGLRVTGSFTTSSDAAALAPNLHLAVAHGITAQIFFALLVSMAAFTSESWRSELKPVPKGEAAEDLISGSTWLVGAVLLQLLLGALLRHFHMSFSWHVSMAVVVIVIVLMNGVRASVHNDVPVVPRVGKGLLHVVSLQVVLGVGALATTLADEGAIARAQVPVTTLHQTVGALVLGYAVLLRVWSARFLSPAEPTGSDKAA